MPSLSSVKDVDKTREDIRLEFRRWKIDASESEIIWEYDKSRPTVRLPGVEVRFMRNNAWQSISCYQFHTRGENLCQCLLLIKRLRIAERFGVQYKGLTSSKAVAVTGNNEVQTEDDRLKDAYDRLGVTPKDSMDLVDRVYKVKSQYVHPDVIGGNAEAFKSLTASYELIKKSREQKT